MNTTATHDFPEELFLGLSHGTLECSEIVATRQFFREFLGVQTLRHGPPSFVTWRGQPSFFIACVEAGDQTKPQGLENHWELAVDTEEEVLAAHAAASREGEAWGIRYVSPLGTLDGFPWFCLQDFNGNYWGISTRSREWLEAVFARQQPEVRQ